MESQVVLHHAAKAVIRLFLAHVGAPPCPWLELASETSFSRFKRKVDDQLLRPRRRGVLEAEAAWVFLGRRNAFPDEELDDWTSAIENLAKFLRTFAERWLKESRVYNALKHGLAIVPGDAVFQLLDDDGKAVRLGEGASVELLEATPWEDDRRAWQITTRWLDVQESLALVEIACLMIESLWLVARHRYVAGVAEGRLFFPSGLKPTDLRGPRSSIHTFSWKLLEERRTR
jgi:hypothetical protein